MRRILQGNWSEAAPFIYEFIWEGKTRNFVGVPNQCRTRHAAIMRGWYRCRWLNQGTFSDYYTRPWPGSQAAAQ